MSETLLVLLGSLGRTHDGRSVYSIFAGGTVHCNRTHKQIRGLDRRGKVVCSFALKDPRAAAVTVLTRNIAYGKGKDSMGSALGG
jgi:hypothetical protein